MKRLALLIFAFLIATSLSAEENSINTSPSRLAQFNQTLDSILFKDMAFSQIKINVTKKNGELVLDQAGKPVKRIIKVPLMIVILAFGGLFFTFWYRFINFRGFKHSIDVIRGYYDNPNDAGEISHFKALTSALSATVGLGNIAGVAIAIQLGGPGAVLWMIIGAFFGMSAKFNSCTLSQLYRKVNSDGTISGGPMYYLDMGFKELGKNWAVVGKILAVIFAIFTMGGAIGGGNMFQVNQTVEAFSSTFNLGAKAGQAIGIIMAVMVGIVILGGIKRIGATTSKIVPGMVVLYVLASLFIILSNFNKIPESIGLIFTMAFTKNAFYGGFMGVLIWGITRASFSNEAGLGSAAIAHAAAKTNEPVREGIVAMIGPFIDTVVVCSMTAMVVIITGVWDDPNLTGKEGVTLTTNAFGSAIEWFPHILTGCIALFAYSTMIAWCYYGERGWIYLLDHFNGIGLKTVIIFRLIFIVFIYIGAVNNLKDVLAFTDLLILSMAFPNIIGSVILAPKVLPHVKDYWKRYKSGKMVRHIKVN